MLRTAAQVSFLVNKDHDRKASDDETLPRYAGARGEIFVLQERLHKKGTTLVLSEN